MTKPFQPFQAGQMAEYGHPGDYLLGGSWYGCKIVEVTVDGRPRLITAKNGHGEWVKPFTAFNYQFRHAPTKPYCIRRRRAAPFSSKSLRLFFLYFVNIGKMFPAVRCGGLSEAHRFATEKEAKAALAKLRTVSAGDWIAISLETAERDEAALVQEAT